MTIRGQILCDLCQGERLVLAHLPSVTVGGEEISPAKDFTISLQLRDVTGERTETGQYPLECGHLSRIVGLTGFQAAQEWLSDQPESRAHLYLAELGR